MTLDKQVDLWEVLVKANFTILNDGNRFKQVIVTRYRGKSMITVLDSTNHITSFSKDLNFHSRYVIDVQGQEEIIGLRKQQIS